jgi:hypothetical protein
MTGCKQTRTWKVYPLLGCLALLVAKLGIVPQIAWAQDVTAGLIGTVTDPSGAPIPGATVIAKDDLRGTTWPTQTNAAGAYTLPRLPASTYDVTVEAKGFETTVRPNIVLEMNQKARVDIQLKLGLVSQKVEVTGAPPLLQTETTQVGTVINSRINEALPLATRNYVQLTLLVPGSTNPNPQTLTAAQNADSAGRPYVNGNREQANNFLLDGLDNNQVSDNLVGYTPSVDAIQEFNMITADAPAEFGNFMGGIINATIKSGTNAFHGDAFEFVRNDIFNAAQWSDNLSGSPKAKMRWNMFGGTFGGPIKKNKLFFFTDYQGERFDNPNTVGPITVMTEAERNGDFSQQLSQNGIQIYNPCANVSGPCQPLPASASSRQPFVGNTIPSSMIDPVAAKLFSSPLYPAPVNGNLVHNQLNASRSGIFGDQGDVKIDYQASDKDHIFGRYSQSRSSNPSFNSFPLFFNSFFETPIHNGVVDWTRSISPSIVNEARVGVNRVLVDNGVLAGNKGNIAEQLGIANGNSHGPGLLALNIGSLDTIGSENNEERFHDTVFQYEDQLVITHNRHVLHTGFQFWRDQINTFYSGNNGVWGFMTYDGQFTSGPGVFSHSSSTVGLGEADFFLGLPESLGLGLSNGVWGQRSSIFGSYIQDDWRATDNLTFNIGVRYENHTPWVEVHNKQTNFGLFSGTQYIAGQGSCPYSNCRALYNSYNLGVDFQPRVGFAWTPKSLGGKTVFRGAYTLSSYLEGTGTNLRLPINPPFNEEFNQNYSSLSFPGSTSDQGLSTLGLPTDPFAGVFLRVWDPNVMPAVVQQWNFSVEHQFAGETTLNIGYVGEHSTHLMVPMPYAQRQLVTPGTATTSPVTAPSVYLAGNPTLVNDLNSTGGGISGTASNGDNLYDALQATLQKRFSNGLQYQVAYTYSKCMTNSSGYYGSWGGQTTPTSPYWQNVYDMRAEWAPCYYDVTHILTGYAVYQLPFGHKMKFGNSWNPVVNAVLGDWQVTGIYSWHTGYPIDISASDASGTNSRGPRANCIGPDRTLDQSNIPAALGGGILWFDPSSYSQPVGTFGTCAPATTRGPGLNTVDLSFQKEFPITESKRLEFRAEFINFANTPILNSPNGGLGSTLGFIQSSQGARNIQFALKFYF